MAKRYSVAGSGPETYDVLGFALDGGESVAAYRKSAEIHESEALPKQRKTWAEVAASPDIGATLKALKKAKKLKQMVRVGIPHELRAKVWPEMSGAAAKSASAQLGPNYYERLLRTVDEKEAEDVASRKLVEGTRGAGDQPRAPWDLLDTIEQIDKDLMRTFPGHRTIANPHGQAALRRLLRAYCGGRNPRTGYCQGMNFLAAMLLCVMDKGGLGKPEPPADASSSDAAASSLHVSTGEEGAFWMMVVLVERLLPSDYFTDGLTGVRVDSEILVDLMKERLPSLHAHLKKHELLMLLPMVTTQWFISLFVYWLPTETLLRLWDCFFYDGLKSKNKTFFRAALTLFKINEAELSQMTDPQQLMDFERNMSRQCHDPEAIVKSLYNKAWIGRFTDESLHAMEKSHREAVAGDVARRAERQAERDAAKLAVESRKSEILSAASEASSSSLSTSRSQGGAGGGEGGGSGSGGGTALDPVGELIAPEAMTELVAARMQNMQLVLAASDGEEDEGDAAEDDEEMWEVVDDPTPAQFPDLSDHPQAGGSEAGPSLDAADSWEATGYLLKRSPAASSSLFKRLGWQRRWFEVKEDHFAWYTTARAAASGEAPHGKVPLSMVLSATAAAQSGCFNIDLGNRVLELSLDGVPKAHHETTVKRWIDAVVKHEQVHMPDEGSHKAKFWKQDKPSKSPAK